MPRRLPPFVECWRDRHGKVRIYHRKGKGARIPLPASIGSDEFNEAYQAALAGQIEAKRARRETPQPGTIAALITSYLGTASYTKLRPTTKTGYGARLDLLRTEHGHRTVAGLTRQRIVAIMQPYADRPGAALASFNLLRILIKHAIEIGWLTYDPSLGIRRPKTTEIRSWTEVEIEAFESRWPIGTKERLAFGLMLYTGQRRSDGGTIRVVQQKTGAKLSIPLHRNLLAILTATERKHVAILYSQYSKPFTVHGFSDWLRRAITTAGLPLECQPHGLRKAAGRRLAEAGCTANEIMAVLGHKTLAEAERYTRQADQAKLATAAVTKLERTESEQKTAPDRFGEMAKMKV